MIPDANHLFEGKTTEVGEAVENLLVTSHERRSNRFRCPHRRWPRSERDAQCHAARRHGLGRDQGGAATAPGLDPADIDDVILGCAMPEGEQGLNVARIASLRAGVPITASAVTVNRFCSSGLQAIATALSESCLARRRS